MIPAMEFAVFIAAAALITVAVLAVSALSSRRKLRRRLEADYGQVPSRRYDEYVAESVASLWRLQKQAENPPFEVDDTTWRDLDMDAVFRRCNAACSSAGEEYLYAALRNPRAEEDDLRRLDAAARCLDADPALRLRVQVLLSGCGRITGNGVADFFAHPGEKRLRFAPLYPLLSLGAVLSLCSIPFLRAGSIVWILLMFVVNIAVYYKTKAPLEAELVSLRCAAALLGGAAKLARLRVPEELAPCTRRLAELGRPLRRIGRFAGSIMGKSGSDLDFLAEYVKIFFQLDFLAYNSVLSTVAKHRESCGEIYRAVGFLDAAVSVASFRRSLPLWCVPQLGADTFALRGLAHPLLENPVGNSVELRRSALITGSNASGKSTFVKAVAVNAILAQSLATCVAVSFALPVCRVMTSMAVADSLDTGESYYIAEIKSLKRILDALETGPFCLCLIDEILKGTNTVERIAASAAVLGSLREKRCLVLAATHDIELTELLEGVYDNFHFEERVSDEGVAFDYTIREGRATTKNAIRLLGALGYPEPVVETARRLAGGFEQTRAWRMPPETRGRN